MLSVICTLPRVSMGSSVKNIALVVSMRVTGLTAQLITHTGSGCPSCTRTSPREHVCESTRSGGTIMRTGTAARASLERSCVRHLECAESTAD